MQCQLDISLTIRQDAFSNCPVSTSPHISSARHTSQGRRNHGLKVKENFDPFLTRQAKLETRSHAIINSFK